MPPKTAPKKKLVFLVNPGAGTRAAVKVRRLAPSVFAPEAFHAEFVDLKDWREIGPRARAAARAGAWAVVAVGGDGTLNQAAQALRGSACRLGLIPAGTGNGYARALGLPLDAAGACGVVARGRVARLDFCAADRDRGFANVLGIGYDAWLAQRANDLRWMNRLNGFARYLCAGLLCLGRLRGQALRLTLDKGRVLEGRFFMVAVANSPQYGFGCTIAPGARLDDGHMDVVCVLPSGPWTFLRNCARLFRKKPLLGSIRRAARSVRIESREPAELAVHMDGEPGGTTPVRVTVRPGALRVLVP